MAENKFASAIRTEAILLMADVAVHFSHGEVKLNAHGRKTAKKENYPRAPS